jgi:type IV pilus assembly protein PilQ
VTIKPTVSSSEFVTLDLDVQQADFDPNSVPGQPRGTSTRSFQSTVRVKNGDMILLGGLEGKASGRAGSGIPFLSRIPVLKWFFGTRSMSKSKTQLNIFIKPTIIY